MFFLLPKNIPGRRAEVSQEARFLAITLSGYRTAPLKRLPGSFSAFLLSLSTSAQRVQG